MTNKRDDQKRLNEKDKERLFRLIMDKAAEKEGKSFLKEQELLKSDPKNRPAPEEIQKFSRHIDTLLRKSTRYVRKKKIRRILSRAAIVVVVTSVCFLTTLFTVDAFRAKVMDFLKTSGSHSNSSSVSMPFPSSLTPSKPDTASKPSKKYSISPSSGSENSSQANMSSQTQQSVLTQIREALSTKVPLMLPKNVSVSKGRFLTAATSSQSTHYQVKFYETDRPVSVNSQDASKGKLLATVEGTRYQSAASAKSQISDYRQIDFSEYDEFLDLGHSVKAAASVGLGHLHLRWNEGRWYIDVDSPADPAFRIKGSPDGEQLAKNVVAYLEEYMLPAPQKIGVINISNWSGTDGSTVRWQDNQTVYRVTSKDPMTALKIAVAMKLVRG